MGKQVKIGPTLARKSEAEVRDILSKRYPKLTKEVEDALALKFGKDDKTTAVKSEPKDAPKKG